MAGVEVTRRIVLNAGLLAAAGIALSGCGRDKELPLEVFGGGSFSYFLGLTQYLTHAKNSRRLDLLSGNLVRFLTWALHLKVPGKDEAKHFMNSSYAISFYEIGQFQLDLTCSIFGITSLGVVGRSSSPLSLGCFEHSKPLLPIQPVANFGKCCIAGYKKIISNSFVQ